MKTAIDTRFFRAGVGTVIYNDAGQIAIFERSQHPIGVWQLQQGGIDIGEDTRTTLWRELREEVGLVPADMKRITEYPAWTVYQDANSVLDTNKSKLGQAHRWFFLHLKDTVTIDLSTATEVEAADYKWVSFAEAIEATDDLKKHVYQDLETYFNEVILKLS